MASPEVPENAVNAFNVGIHNNYLCVCNRVIDGRALLPNL